MKTLILFDLDGTLVYSNRRDSLCFAETYQAIYSKPFPTIDWTRYPHVTDTTILTNVIRSHFGRDPRTGEFELFQERYVSLLVERRQESPDEFREVPHARTMLARLASDERYLLGLATGGWERPAQVKLAHIGVDPGIFLAAYADRHLTRPSIIGEALEKAFHAHEQISRVVYVGDALWDVHTTREMQMALIGIRVQGDREFLLREGVSHVMTDYGDWEFFLEAVEGACAPAPVRVAPPGIEPGF